MKFRWIGLCITVALLLSGCGLGMIPTLTPTPDYSTPTFVIEPPTPEPTPINNSGNYVEPILPDWFNHPLIDVTNGEPYRIALSYGKLTLVHFTSLNCVPCLNQAKEIALLKKVFIPADSLDIISIDINPADTTTDLKAYAQENAFRWRISLANTEMLSKLASNLGSTFFDSLQGNLVIIDPLGEAHPLPVGFITAQDLQLAFDPYLK